MALHRPGENPIESKNPQSGKKISYGEKNPNENYKNNINTKKEQISVCVKWLSGSYGIGLQWDMMVFRFS